MSKQTIEFTARARFFTGFGVETLPVMVDGETVRVWDSIAGHYTTVHRLTERQQRRIRRLAAEQAA